MIIIVKKKNSAVSGFFPLPFLDLSQELISCVMLANSSEQVLGTLKDSPVKMILDIKSESCIVPTLDMVLT